MNFLHVYLHHHAWILFAAQCLFLKVDCQTSFSDISLSSPTQCASGRINDVGISKGYIIQPVKMGQVNPSFIDCKLTFQSERADGRICLSQEGRKAEIQDNNAQLTVYDGTGDQDPQVFRIEYGPDKWSKREYCTTSRSLYMHLEMKDPTRATNITELHMQFKVQDIQSKDRIFYLEDDYCDRKYELENSQITIMNRLPYKSPLPVRKVKDLCMMELERKENNKSMTCVVYLPGKKRVSCGKMGWEFWVSYDGNLNIGAPNYFAYTHKCVGTSQSLQKMHLWCAKNTSNLLYFYLSRNNINLMSDSSEEPPGMFSLVVKDYSESQEDLIKLIENELLPGTTTTEMPNNIPTEMPNNISTEMPIEKSKEEPRSTLNNKSGGMPAYVVFAIVVVAFVEVILSIIVFKKCWELYKTVPANSGQ